MIEMTFFVTKFFASVYKLKKTLKTVRNNLPMIIIVINCLSNMTFLAAMLFTNSRNFRDLPVFGQISLFFSTKNLKSLGFDNLL